MGDKPTYMINVQPNLEAVTKGSRPGFFANLSEENKELYIKHLLDKDLTLKDISLIWGGRHIMNISKDRRDPRLIGEKTKAGKKAIEKAIKKGVLKASLHDDIASVAERAQHIFDAEETGGKPNRKAQLEALKVELLAYKDRAALEGLGQPEPVQQAPATVSVVNMIGLPRTAPAKTQEEVAEAGVEYMDRVDDDVRMIEEGEFEDV